MELPQYLCVHPLSTMNGFSSVGRVRRYPEIHHSVREWCVSCNIVTPKCFFPPVSPGIPHSDPSAPLRFFRAADAPSCVFPPIDPILSPVPVLQCKDYTSDLAPSARGRSDRPQQTAVTTARSRLGSWMDQCWTLG